jgi:hypothetical protein
LKYVPGNVKGKGAAAHLNCLLRIQANGQLGVKAQDFGE